MNKQNYGMGLPEGYEQLTYFVRANAPQYLINQIRAKFPEVNADSDLMISGDVKIVRDKRFKNIEVKYILFSDKKTFIEFEEQDYYSYSDCSPYAKYITVCSDVEAWKKIFKYEDANEDIC